MDHSFDPLTAHECVRFNALITRARRAGTSFWQSANPNIQGAPRFLRQLAYDRLFEIQGEMQLIYAKIKEEHTAAYRVRVLCERLENILDAMDAELAA